MTFNYKVVDGWACKCLSDCFTLSFSNIFRVNPFKVKLLCLKERVSPGSILSEFVSKKYILLDKYVS